METEPKAQEPIIPKKKRAAKHARLPRTIDPEVTAIRKEATSKVKELHRARASARLLKTILEKRLAKLTQQDRESLFDYLKQPALIVSDFEIGGVHAPKT